MTDQVEALRACEHRFQNGPSDPWQPCILARGHSASHVWATGDPQAEALRNRIASMVHSARMGVDECDAAADRILAALTPPATTSGVRCGDCGADLTNNPVAATGHVCPPATASGGLEALAVAVETLPAYRDAMWGPFFGAVNRKDAAALIRARLTKPEESHD